MNFFDYSENKFRAKFVDTFISTAIDSLTNTAIDESLHELNIILPGVNADYIESNKDYERQIYWVGNVQLEENQENDLPSEIYVGGDIKYGLGRLKSDMIENETSYPIISLIILPLTIPKVIHTINRKSNYLLKLKNHGKKQNYR